MKNRRNFKAAFFIMLLSVGFTTGVPTAEAMEHKYKFRCPLPNTLTYTYDSTKKAYIFKGTTRGNENSQFEIKYIMHSKKDPVTEPIRLSNVSFNGAGLGRPGDKPFMCIYNVEMWGEKTRIGLEELSSSPLNNCRLQGLVVDIDAATFVCD